MEEILKIIFSLYLYADVTKKIHYSTQSMNRHKLCDEIRDAVVEYTDSVAEDIFGYYGKPSFEEIPPLSDIEINETNELDELCSRLSDVVTAFRSLAENSGKLSGLSSKTDDFIGKLNKFKFLATFDRFK